MKKILLYIICIMCALFLYSTCFAYEGVDGEDKEVDVSGLIDDHDTDPAAHADLQIDVQSYTAAAVTLTDTDTREVYHFNGDDDAIDFTLIGAAEGLVRCFDAGGFDQVITVDVADGTDTLILDGTALTAGNAIDTAGTGDEKFCVVGKDTTYWVVINGTATLADGGAD